MKCGGFVLAGGASSRMGRDKALLPYRGGTLLSSVASAVREAVGSATVIGPPDRYEPLGFLSLADRRPGHGPLSGIETALWHTETDWNLIVACDMPGVSTAFLAGLLDRAALSDVDCIMPVGGSGRPHPLCAVYHRRCLPAVSRALDEGTRKVLRALEGLRLALVLAEAAPLANANTPEEWQNCLNSST